MKIPTLTAIDRDAAELERLLGEVLGGGPRPLGARARALLRHLTESRPLFFVYLCVLFGALGFTVVTQTAATWLLLPLGLYPFVPGGALCVVEALDARAEGRWLDAAYRGFWASIHIAILGALLGLSLG